MVRHGGDLNSLSTTITTVRLWSHRGWQLWTWDPKFRTKIVRNQIDPSNSYQLDPSNLSSLVWWMVRQGWDWNLIHETVTTTYLWAMGRYNFGLASIHFSRQDSVYMDWFKQFTSAWPFQYPSSCMMNGFAWLRLDFMVNDLHHILTFESQVVTIWVPVPYVSYQDCVFLRWFQSLTSAWPFQYLSIDMMNDYAWLRLESVSWNSHCNLVWSHGWVQIWLGLYPLTTPR